MWNHKIDHISGKVIALTKGIHFHKPEINMGSPMKKLQRFLIENTSYILRKR